LDTGYYVHAYFEYFDLHCTSNDGQVSGMPRDFPGTEADQGRQARTAAAGLGHSMTIVIQLSDNKAALW
jgi:hypothetical protein